MLLEERVLIPIAAMPMPAGASRTGDSPPWELESVWNLPVLPSTVDFFRARGSRLVPKGIGVVSWI
jgi:hypothetical protein